MIKILFFLFFVLSTSTHALTIVCLGDSLTEGYQLAREDAFPAIMELELRKTFPNIKIINGGSSGATSASGPKRVAWYLKAKPDWLILALGANDGLRGLDLKETEKNLRLVIEKAQQSKIKVLLVGMKMPVNYGEPYRGDFEKLFPSLAKRYTLPLVPFLLDGVASRPEFNISDGIHPNVKGHQIMAKNILKVLRPLL